MKKIQIVLNAILQKHAFEYLLVNFDLKVEYCSNGLKLLAGQEINAGDDLLEIFPELYGMGLQIKKLQKNRSGSLELKTISRGKKYINIYLDYYDEKHMLVLVQNITELAESQRDALQYSNETILLYGALQNIIDEQKSLISVFDASSLLKFANKKFLRYFNLKDGEFDKKKSLQILKKLHKDATSCADLYEIYDSKNTIINIGADTFSVDVKLINYSQYLITLVEITDIYNKTKELKIQVEHDDLTGVYRKNYFDKLFKEYFYATEGLALVVVDIDDFKKINDTYGHQVGDEVLKEFAHHLRGHTRDGDLLARWGGEEFLFALKIESANKAFRRIDGIRKSIESYVFTDVKSVTASFGIAFKNRDDDPDSMLLRADKALYVAKSKGKNRVVFKEKLNPRS